jgi:zinc protease
MTAQRPVPGPPRPFGFPPIHRDPDGAVLVCDLPGRPVVTAVLLVAGGAAAEPVDAAGVTGLTARLLDQGTRRRDAAGFALAMERLGAQWWTSVRWDAALLGVEVPADELPAALALLAEALYEPAFDPAAVDRVRAETVDELWVALAQPATLATRTLSGQLFDPTSRYAVGADGTPDTVAALATGRIPAWHADRFARQHCTLVLAGELRGLSAAAAADRVFGGTPATGPAAPAPIVRPTGARRQVVVVDRPGAAQSALSVGHVGPPRDIPDFVPLTTMVTCLGGLFDSRLNLKLREEKGYTYGSRAGFELRRHGGVFAARAAVATAVTAPALVDLVAEIERMHAEGVTEEELGHARDYRAGVFPVEFADAAAVALGLTELVVHGWPDDHFDRQREELAVVPLPAVNEAAGSYLHPDELVMVVVGDATKVADEVQATGLGPVTVVPAPRRAD